MFEVGFSELLVIFVLALIVLGPEKLPRLAAQVGRWVGRARAMARQFREQLEEEVNVAESNKWKSTQPPPPSPEPAAAAEPAVTPESAVTPAAEDASATAADGSHASVPPGEPEAAVYEPPAYSSAPPAEAEPMNGAESHAPVESAHSPEAEQPLRPGDVVTTTHERGN